MRKASALTPYSKDRDGTALAGTVSFSSISSPPPFSYNFRIAPDGAGRLRTTNAPPASIDMCPEGRCCQTGWDCMGDGTCCPSGQKRCGNSKCYDPRRSKCCTGPGTVWGCDLSDTCCTGGFCRKSSEQCCRNGSCDRDATCCENECCLSGAFCGRDGYCQPCPPTTRTVTSTTSGTTTTTRTVTAEGDPAEDAPEFSCLPMTATNRKGATLELGDDCALKYGPPPADSTSSTGLAARAAPALETPCPFVPETEAPTPTLAPRQEDCTPLRTITRTEWRTQGATRTVTVTSRAREPAEEGFSCLAMEATNAAGDVLALDELCGLAFTPAEPSAASEDEEDDAHPRRSLGMAVIGPVVAVWAVWLLV